jgi:hypothetical protein
LDAPVPCSPIRLTRRHSLPRCRFDRATTPPVLSRHLGTLPTLAFVRIRLAARRLPRIRFSLPSPGFGRMLPPRATLVLGRIRFPLPRGIARIRLRRTAAGIIRIRLRLTGIGASRFRSGTGILPRRLAIRVPPSAFRGMRALIAPLLRIRGKPHHGTLRWTGIGMGSPIRARGSLTPT